MSTQVGPGTMAHDLVSAASAGDAARVRTLLQSSLDGDATLSRAAISVAIASASSGHPEVVLMLQYAQAPGAEAAHHSLTFAAARGYIELVRMLRHEDVAAGGVEEALQNAALHGHDDICRLLVERSATLPWRVVDMAFHCNDPARMANTLRVWVEAQALMDPGVFDKLATRVLATDAAEMTGLREYLRLQRSVAASVPSEAMSLP